MNEWHRRVRREEINPFKDINPTEKQMERKENMERIIKVSTNCLKSKDADGPIQHRP